MSWEELELAWEPDAGWIEVPDDPNVDLEAWAVAAVLDRAGSDGAEQAGPAVDALAVHARAAVDGDAAPVAAWLLVPDPLAEPLAACRLDLLDVVPGEVPDLDQLEQALSEAHPAHLEAPVVTRRLLPAGWAVRQQVLRTDDATSEDVHESVTFAVLLPGVDDALLRLTTTWLALAHGEVLAEQADRLAASITVVVGHGER